MATISFSVIFLIISHFHEGYGTSTENEIEDSITEKMEKDILGKLEIAYGFSWPARMGLEEMISAISKKPLDKSKCLYELKQTKAGFVSYFYHLRTEVRGDFNIHGTKSF